MKTEPLINVLSEISARLVTLAAEDPQFRLQLRQLAHALLEATDTPQQETGHSAEVTESVLKATDLSEERLSVGDSTPVAVEQRAAELPDSPFEVLPKLTLGQAKPITEAQPADSTYPSSWTTTAAVDLTLIESRCRMKEDGARWAANRSSLLKQGADFQTEIAPLDGNIISKAKVIPDCFLWMCHRGAPSPTNLNLWQDVAGCFKAVAEGLSLLRQIESRPEDSQAVFQNALDLLAEAQSALRCSIEAIGGPSDLDQVQVFEWLKQTASSQHVYIQRFMRIDDPANPTQWSRLSSRIEALESQWQQNQKRTKERRKKIGNVRHKLSQLTGATEEDSEFWRQIIAIIEELVSDGLPPSDSELRELLLPKIDGLPDQSEIPKGFQLVLREIDRFLANRPQSESTPDVLPSKEITEVRSRLKKRTMVLIGGDRRPASYQALKDAFSLKDLIWIETREHQSIAGFESSISHPDVAVVILAIRWSSHAFGDVIDFCDRYNKPLVRLPGGYNPNQVAVQIMGQCSERLPVQAPDPVQPPDDGQLL